MLSLTVDMDNELILSYLVSVDRDTTGKGKKFKNGKKKQKLPVLSTFHSHFFNYM